MEPPPLEPAPFGRRIAALAVDIFLLLFSASAYFLAIAFSAGFESLRDLGTVLLASVPLVISWLAYFAYLDGVQAATYGKRRLGLAVVDSATGEKIGWKRGLRRWVVLFLTLPAWPMLGVVFHDRRSRGPHDKAVHSLVVRSRGRHLPTAHC